ncbi:MAG: EamA family transporter [Alphaproteobacteria bacterium]
MVDDPRLLALGAAALYGSALVLTQVGLRHLPPLAGARIGVPSATVLLWLAALPAVDWSAGDPRATAIFAAIGLLFPAAVTLLTYEANRRMGPSVAGALGNLAPLFAVALAAAALAELPRLAELAALGLIVVGVVAIALDRRWDGRAWPLWALALPLAAALVRGGVQSAVKLGLERWPSALAATAIGYAVSSMVVIAAAHGRVRPAGMKARRAGAGWFVLVGLCNGGAVLLTYAALARGPVSLVAPLVATYPVATLALSRVFLARARPAPAAAAGVALTVAGVVLLLAA